MSLRSDKGKQRKRDNDSQGKHDFHGATSFS
jgi:hypothetical protein